MATTYSRDCCEYTALGTATTTGCKSNCLQFEAVYLVECAKIVTVTLAASTDSTCSESSISGFTTLVSPNHQPLHKVLTKTDLGFPNYTERSTINDTTGCDEWSFTFSIPGVPNLHPDDRCALRKVVASRAHFVAKARGEAPFSWYYINYDGSGKVTHEQAASSAYATLTVTSNNAALPLLPI